MRIASSERLQALRATSGDAWARATKQGGLEPPL
jgi:hypothetical protein